MNNKLELIKDLRMEIKEITADKNEISADNNRCIIEIKNISNEINRLNAIWCDNRKTFEDECRKKIGKAILPTYGFIALISGYICAKVIGIELDLGITNYIIGYGLSSILLFTSYFTNIDTPDIYHNYKNERKQRIVNRRRKYLFKKYPHIEKTYNDLMSLAGELKLKEEQLCELKSERQNLEVKFQDVCNLLSSKEQELSELEKEYIDIVINNTTNKNTATVTKEKGKSRVRRKEEN